MGNTDEGAEGGRGRNVSKGANAYFAVGAGTTIAATLWPHVGSSTPTTQHSATCSFSSSKFSISQSEGVLKGKKGAVGN